MQHHDMNDAHVSTERIVYEITKAYWDLVDRCGKHRANEILTEFLRRQEDYLAQDRIASYFDREEVLKMCEEKIVAGEATGWMKAFYWANKGRHEKKNA